MNSRPGDMTAGEVLETRTVLGLSREELARRLEVSWQTVWRWEKGKATPSRRAQRAIRRLT